MPMWMQDSDVVDLASEKPGLLMHRRADAAHVKQVNRPEADILQAKHFQLLMGCYDGEECGVQVAIQQLQSVQCPQLE